MPSFRESHRGLSAFLILLISILPFFALQQLHGPLKGEFIQHKNSNAPSPIYDTVNSLAKRVAIPFGDISSSNFSNTIDQDLTLPRIVKRVPAPKRTWTLTFPNAVCKGRQLKNMIYNSQGNKKTDAYVYKDLDSNGWTVSDATLFPLPDPLNTALSATGLDIADFVKKDAELDHPFTKSDGTTVPNDGGWFRSAYNVKKGAIIAIDMASADFIVNYGVDPPKPKAQVNAETPDIKRWADITWIVWQNLAGKASAPSLQYIFHDNVVTDDTQHIMDVTMGNGSPTTGSLNAPWPGRTFDLNSDEGCALLATPHGVGIAWLLTDYKGNLGRRTPKITVWSGIDTASGRNQYFLMFNLQ